MDATAGMGRRRVPIRAHDRPHRLPLSHANENRPRARVQAAAPDVWVELCPSDAKRLGIDEGDLVRVSSPRGSVEAPARLRDIREGAVFIPFHYGYWDLGEAGPNGRPRAANELTMTSWDPVSKQPQLKTAAVNIERVE